MAEEFEPERPLTPEELKQRKRRNVAIGLSLGAFVLIVFIVTMLKLAGNAPQG
ncbi:hypothetical protein [Hyphococcus luteus]|uniref:hypothetical protein n=1 Tax=Hyphococcus luteus TaxID=2058213 RepID=UPI0013FD85CC|nr:hypothetical protein [Marinicaulis flavus]